MGTILIIFGIIILGIGIAMLIKSQKGIVETAIQEEKKRSLDIEGKYEERIENEIKKRESEIKTQNKKELEHSIVLAAADGVITKSEKQMILNKALEFGIDKAKLEEQILIELDKTKDNAETKLIDIHKESGNKFEGYIVSKFNKGCFTIKEWAGDKFIDGLYAETTLHPDIKVSLKAEGNETEFAIECKFRSKYNENGTIIWAGEKQLSNYRDYEQKYKIPVFVAIGIGGNAKQPTELFIIPLKHIKHTFLYRDFVEKYIKLNHLETPMYFNPKTLTLK